MLLYAVSFVLYSLAPAPVWLILPSVLQAGAMVATFPMGIAYIGDVVEARDRAAAIGVYTAAMGSGFAVGPLIGSVVGSAAGYPAAYAAGAVIALAGAAFALAAIDRTEGRRSEGRSARPPGRSPRAAVLDAPSHDRHGVRRQRRDDDLDDGRDLHVLPRLRAERRDRHGDHRHALRVARDRLRRRAHSHGPAVHPPAGALDTGGGARGRGCSSTSPSRARPHRCCSRCCW